MENATNADIFLRANGRAAMMGFIAICAVYAVTGQIIPGVVWYGIRSSSNRYAYSNRCSSEKIMNYDWTLLQTLIFIITPYFVMLALASKDEDDDGSDGGMMQPLYAPAPGAWHLR